MVTAVTQAEGLVSGPVTGAAPQGSCLAASWPLFCSVVFCCSHLEILYTF